MSLLLVVALGHFTYLMVPRMRLLTQLRGEALWNDVPQRILGTLKFAIGQWRMPREPIAGLAHIFIFSGFMIVSVATVTHFVHAFVPGWHLPGLGGRAGDIYTLIKDSSEYLVLSGVGYGLWRRLKRTPSRVGRSWEGVFVLVMIFVLMATDFLTAGGELVESSQSGLPFSPGGALGAALLRPLGVDGARIAGQASYWLHCAAVLLFLNFLPLGKHFHVITGIPNVFFRNLEVAGFIPKVDLENAESFGIRSSADMTWSMGLDVYSCTECGRCNVYCPTVLTGKPLSHRQLNLDLKKALFRDKDAILSGDAKRKEQIEPLVDHAISQDTIWACTSCGSCEQECPVYIEQTPRIIQLRQNKVLTDGDVPPELARAYKGMENNNNPWNIAADERDKWAEGLSIPRMADIAPPKEGAPTPLLYWIGCAGSFDDRNKKITLAMVKILQAAKVPFAILGKEEGCTGDVARRTGNEYLFQALAQTNVDMLNQYKVQRLLTHCPHCLHTIKSEYPQFGGHYEVVHHTQLIEELLAEGDLKLADAEKNGDALKKIALHDSCYLGRYHQIYDAPRNILKAVPNTRVVELPRNKSRSVCCGAGGGRFWMEETIGERINVHRAKEVAAADATGVGSSCPFCLTMMKDGLGHIGKEAVTAEDVSEIVAAAI
jgi:Fe-S oxidoreductase